MAELKVSAFRSLEAVAPLRDAIRELDLCSRRPCPFATLEYMETLRANDEYAEAAGEPLFLVAREGQRLIGYLPLRRRAERVLRLLPGRRVDLLLTRATDRPFAVSRPEDEARCAAAFYRHLTEEERGIGYLELTEQDASSRLIEPPPLSSRWWVRRHPGMPNTTVPLGHADLAEYYRSLSKSFRHKVSSWSRKILQAGAVELVSSRDPGARLGLLELYLDLERRSWKPAAGATVGRHPARVAFFRALCAPSQPMALGFDLLLLDGLPVAGIISGAFGTGENWIETAYDRDYADVSPGQLMWLLGMRRAIRDGRSHVNLGPNYPYYKSRWGGTVTETVCVELIRVGSARWLKATLGDLRRRLRPPSAAGGAFNPVRREQDDEAERPERGPRPARLEERAAVHARLTELAAGGVPIERRSGRALTETLPFAVSDAAVVGAPPRIGAS
jgi:CelD/BcsL family acetyltransferase involved in cellulose biosynthesis